MTENKVIVNGVRYVAVDETDRCTGCAGGCPGSALCRSLPVCTAWTREDGRDIVWQRDPSATGELTALREMNPELVEALEDLRDHMNSLDPSSMESVEAAEASMKRAGALIAKARGKA